MSNVTQFLVDSPHPLWETVSPIRTGLTKHRFGQRMFACTGKLMDQLLLQAVDSARVGHSTVWTLVGGGGRRAHCSHYPGGAVGPPGLSLPRGLWWGRLPRAGPPQQGIRGCRVRCLMAGQTPGDAERLCVVSGFARRASPGTGTLHGVF